MPEYVLEIGGHSLRFASNCKGMLTCAEKLSTRELALEICAGFQQANALQSM